MTPENDILRLHASRTHRADPYQGAEPGAIDAWLRKELSAQYNPTLAEALPAEMLALLNELH